MPLDSDQSFRFLFVGGTVLRKGIDVLLKAYLQAFDATDDVCLVIKDNPQDVFYEGVRCRDEIAARCDQPSAAAIIYLDRFLSTADMAALYRTCDVGVFPYRAEGFALPILEAMACGTPSIVPHFGACLDFCSDRTSFLVPVKRINLPVGRDFTFNTLGFRETVDEVDFCEVSVPVLADAMRRVYELSQSGQAGTPGGGIAQRAARGVRVAHDRFTWDHTLRHMARALDEVQRTKIPVRMRRRRRENERHKRVFDTARELYLELPSSGDLPLRHR
jgi:glycosyltransferase involved in cell wall biosynthesis